MMALEREAVRAHQPQCCRQREQVERSPGCQKHALWGRVAWQETQNTGQRLTSSPKSWASSRGQNPWKSRTQIHVEVLTMEDVPACLEWLLARASRFHEGTFEWEAQWVLLIPGAIANSKILRSSLVIKQEATRKVGSTWRFNAMILMPTPAVAGHHILTPLPWQNTVLVTFLTVVMKSPKKGSIDLAYSLREYSPPWWKGYHSWSVKPLTHISVDQGARGRRHLDVGLSYILSAPSTTANHFFQIVFTPLGLNNLPKQCH